MFYAVLHKFYQPWVLLFIIYNKISNQLVEIFASIEFFNVTIQLIKLGKAFMWKFLRNLTIMTTQNYYNAKNAKTNKFFCLIDKKIFLRTD